MSLEDALNQFDERKKETIEQLTIQAEENDFLSFVSEYYGIPAFSSKFMIKIKSLKEGKSKNVFGTISFSVLLDIFKNNNFQKTVRNMPIGKNLMCEDKLNYDLAVALKKYGSFVKFQKTKDEKYSAIKEAKQAIEYLKKNSVNKVRTISSSKITKESDILF